MLEVISMNEIRRATRRRSFNQDELALVKTYLDRSNEKGYDVRFHRKFLSEATLADGMIVLESPLMLSTQILYVKVDAGRGLFGGVKTKIQTFIGSLEHDEFQAGFIFDSFITALVRFNKVYEDQGY